VKKGERGLRRRFAREDLDERENNTRTSISGLRKEHKRLGEGPSVSLAEAKIILRNKMLPFGKKTWEGNSHTFLKTGLASSCREPPGKTQEHYWKQMQLPRESPQALINSAKRIENHFN